MTSRLPALLGIDSPIVLGAFGGLSSVELTAAVSNAGGLGSYGLYGYDADRITRTAAELRARTDRPIALNLWMPTGDEVSPDDVDWEAATTALAPLFEQVGLEVPERPARFLPDVDEQLEAVIAARPAVLSVVFGVPDRQTMERLHEAGIVVVGTATTPAEAVFLERAGVDAVVATGPEAGGHRVSFLAPAEESLIGTIALVPAVTDAVSVPVIAAGGIADRRGVAAAFALGAEGVQIGTAFLRAAESAAPASHRAALAGVAESGTVLTRAMSGRLARGVRNVAVSAIETGESIAPFPAQNWLTGRFRSRAAELDRGELLSLWAGQGAALLASSSPAPSAADVFAELAAGLPH
ncbi:NAD(P)H-dependent flavin oxidoreductase [Microbacterium nymphoidis]|jgi:nitronate monooxygenase|uniref:NAD(P)H-dependent flavin oxidoreductase n=1 Tax=Microbacterium nymphoidis TaxID=2898586 RepID=UPI001E3E5B96|nr:nitronate monooxygenase [Microbacterium nymphoidis]MCD2498247.1 nitronate monooxygenase [Microbacterium nymphoidis]